MTVSELIEELKEMPQDAEVTTEILNCRKDENPDFRFADCFSDIGEVEILRAIHWAIGKSIPEKPKCGKDGVFRCPSCDEWATGKEGDRYLCCMCCGQRFDWNGTYEI